MPLPCYFTVSKEKLEQFRSGLEAASSSPPSLWTSWKTCWERVADSLDQAEARACETGDVASATQIVRLNSLIRWCLKPDWDCLAHDGEAVTQTFRCSVSDWTDQWSCFKICLGRYHLEEFQDTMLDLERLRASFTGEEESWAQVAQQQVQCLVDDVAQVLRAPYEVETA